MKSSLVKLNHVSTLSGKGHLRILLCNTHIYNFCKSYVEKLDGEYRLMRYFLPDSSVVFDVGAHTGEWAKHALTIHPNLAMITILWKAAQVMNPQPKGSGNHS